MDFELWESRNLARSILAQLYSTVIHRYEEDVRRAERHRSQEPRKHIEAPLSTSNRHRFSGRLSRLDSIGTLLDEEDSLVLPRLRRGNASFHRRSSVDDSITFWPGSAGSSESQISLRRTQSTAALGPDYPLTIERPLWHGSSSVAYYRYIITGISPLFLP
ncbi:hypothetical protein COOONC_24731 [Cooperia oncophora]